MSENKRGSESARVSKITDYFESAVSIVCFGGMFALVLVLIFMRFVLQKPFLWGEEAARYFMVTGIYMGMSIAVREKAHLGVDVFLNMMPKRLSKVIRLVGELLTVAAYGVISYAAYTFIAKTVASGQTSPALQMPMWLIYGTIFLGFILCILESVLNLCGDYVLNKNEEGVDES